MSSLNWRCWRRIDLSPRSSSVKIHRPLVVITEIHLKDGSGLSLTEIIATRFPDTIVMVLTINDGAGIRGRSTEKRSRLLFFQNRPERQKSIGFHPGPGVGIRRRINGRVEKKRNESVDFDSFRFF